MSRLRQVVGITAAVAVWVAADAITWRTLAWGYYFDGLQSDREPKKDPEEVEPAPALSADQFPTILDWRVVLRFINEIPKIEKNMRSGARPDLEQYDEGHANARRGLARALGIEVPE